MSGIQSKEIIFERIRLYLKTEEEILRLKV